MSLSPSVLRRAKAKISWHREIFGLGRRVPFALAALSQFALHADGQPVGTQPAEAPPTGAIMAISDPDSSGTLSENPEVNGLLRLAASLALRGDYNSSEIAYRQILNRPDFPIGDKKTALLGLAHMFRKAGALTKAAAVYEKFVFEFPDDSRLPDAFLDLGRTLRDMGAYNLAFNRFYSVINSTLKLPASGFDRYTLLAKTAQFEIAQTYYDSGNYPEAAKFFARVRLLDLAPADRAWAHFMAGCAQAKAGDLPSAVSTLREFIKQWPDDNNVPEARFLLATTLDTLKRSDEALAVTLDLLEAERHHSSIDPKRWVYWQRRTGNRLANSFFQNGDMLHALAVYERLLDLSPEPSWRLPIVYQIALCDEQLYQPEGARAAYQTILDAASPAAGSPPPSDLTVELAQMAGWRMKQLAWRDDLNLRLSSVLDPGVRPENSPKAQTAPTTSSTPHAS